MIIDRLLRFSSEQDLSQVAADYASTDVIDFGQANPDLGMTDLCSMVITVDESAAAAGAATVTFSVQDSADNATWADVVATGATPKAALGAGQRQQAAAAEMPGYFR